MTHDIDPDLNLLDTERVLIVLARSPDTMLSIKQITKICNQMIGGCIEHRIHNRDRKFSKYHIKNAVTELFERGAIQCNSDANKFSL